MGFEKIDSRLLIFNMLMDGLTIGEIARFTHQSPKEVMEHLSWYSSVGLMRADFYCQPRNIESISKYYRDQKIEIILKGLDIFDEEDVDEETKKIWQEEWTIRELSKVLRGYRGSEDELPLEWGCDVD